MILISSLSVNYCMSYHSAFYCITFSLSISINSKCLEVILYPLSVLYSCFKIHLLVYYIKTLLSPSHVLWTSFASLSFPNILRAEYPCPPQHSLQFCIPLVAHQPEIAFKVERTAWNSFPSSLSGSYSMTVLLSK
jgi:hypothetical protein